eukprot:tig00001030_g6463.t1
MPRGGRSQTVPQPHPGTVTGGKAVAISEERAAAAATRTGRGMRQPSRRVQRPPRHRVPCRRAQGAWQSSAWTSASRSGSTSLHDPAEAGAAATAVAVAAAAAVRGSDVDGCRSQAAALQNFISISVN